jgi:hypothetical protein
MCSFFPSSGDESLTGIICVRCAAEMDLAAEIALQGFACDGYMKCFQ